MYVYAIHIEERHCARGTKERDDTGGRLFTGVVELSESPVDETQLAALVVDHNVVRLLGITGSRYAVRAWR